MAADAFFQHCMSINTNLKISTVLRTPGYFSSYCRRQHLPAGSACSPGTTPLPVSRLTSLLLYRTESSVSTILEGSSCFMLFHQSATDAQRCNSKSTKHIQANWAVLHGDDVPVLSKWGRSYVPSEVFFLPETSKVKRAKKKKPTPPPQKTNTQKHEERRWIPVLPVASTAHNQYESHDHDQHGNQDCCQSHI